MSSELFQNYQAVSEIQLNMNIKISRILHGKSWEVYFRFLQLVPVNYRKQHKQHKTVGNG